MILSLRADNLLLDARQKLLRLGQRHPQIRDVAQVLASAEFHHVNTSRLTRRSRLDQPQNPPSAFSHPAPTRAVLSLPKQPPLFGQSRVRRSDQPAR